VTTTRRASALTIARNFGLSGAGGASTVLLLLLLIAAGRMLGDDAYGRFAFALALATILETLMDFGLKEVVTRSVARERDSAPRLVANTFGLKLALSLASMALLTAAALVLRPEAEVRIACILLGVSAVLRSYMLTVRHLLNGLERFGLDSIVLVADRFLLLALGLLALRLGYGLLGLAAAFVAARLAAFGLAHALATWQIGAIGVRFDTAYWRDLARAAAPFGAFIVVLNLYSYVDTIMLGVLRTDQETGFYSAAYRAYEGLVNLAAILATVVGPRLAREFVRDRAHHRWLARWSVVASVVAAAPLAAGVALWARDIMLLLFGEPFAPSTPALRLLAAGFVFVFPLQVMYVVAMSVNEDRVLVRAAVVGCIANIALNAALIPGYGITGASVATVVSEGLSLGVIVAGVRRFVWTDRTPAHVAPSS
jgi:O-antigen/teichoic acid export membrane protein